jgi:two-component system, cell cycle sensor histidine kinase and response regulator CckA
MEPVHANPAAPSSGRILVVDDDPAVGRAIRAALRPLPVTFAQSAVGALARIEAGGHFDAIVCDLHMPGMDGIRFQAELARLAPDLAAGIVFVTGGATTPEAADFLSRTPNTCVAKPFTSQELRAAVAAASAGAVPAR